MVYWPYIKFLKNTPENSQMYHLLKSDKQNRDMPMSLVTSLDRFPGFERTSATGFVALTFTFFNVRNGGLPRASRHCMSGPGPYSTTEADRSTRILYDVIPDSLKLRSRGKTIIFPMIRQFQFFLPREVRGS